MSSRSRAGLCRGGGGRCSGGRRRRGLLLRERGQRLLEVEVPLKETSPSSDIDVHLVGARDFSLLPEDLALAPKLRLASDHRIEELNLKGGKNMSNRNVK